MCAPTGANGSCGRAHKKFLLGATSSTRLLHMEAPSELLLEALRGLKVGASKGAFMKLLEVAAPRSSLGASLWLPSSSP